MTLNETIDAIAQKTGLQKKDVRLALGGLIEVTQEELLTTPNENAEIRISPLGKFTQREVKPAKGRKIGANVVDVKHQLVVAWEPFTAARNYLG